MRLVRFVAIVMVAAACGDDPKLTVAELMKPETCAECHPKHYQQWAGSMHAYAADDPVFLAMNARGQRDTGGALGDFCVRCHAPMALELGLASGATFDPAALPSEAKGVTCFFCHNVEAVEGDHNNPLKLAMDQTMRGGLNDPVESPAHHSRYDALMDSKTSGSTICGACHDVVLPNGVHLERSFAEWKTTVFALANTGPASFLNQSCSGCHMFPTTDVVADGPGLETGVRQFGFHEHLWPGIDQAMIPWPDTEQQARAIQRDLDAAVQIVGLRKLGQLEPYGGICVEPQGFITVRVDSPSVGHMFPSGAAHDRRSWIELQAFDAAGQLVFQSGLVPDGMDPEQTGDPYMSCTGGAGACASFWDRTFKATGEPAHFFWEVETIDSKLLAPQTVLDPNAPGYDHSTTVRYTVGPAIASQIDRVEARLEIRALPYATLDDLIASGDLDPAIRGRLPTLASKGATSVWERATAGTGLAQFTNCNPR